MNNTYIAGQEVRLSVEIDDAITCAAVDPGALRLKVRDPSKSVTTYTYGTDSALVKDDIGRYRADILLTTPGLWVWRWESDTPNAGAIEGRVNVATTLF